MDTNLEKKRIDKRVKMTETTVRKIELALIHGFSVSTACRISGISRETYYSHIAKNPELSDRFEVAQEMISYKARNNILRAIAQGSISESRFWLERKSRSEFAPPKATY
jgi:hypothetical protein